MEFFKKPMKPGFIILLVLAVSTFVFGQSERSLIREGNQHYDKDKRKNLMRLQQFHRILFLSACRNYTSIVACHQSDLGS